MIELPEAAVLAQQVNETIKGKRIANVITAKSPHKFAFFSGDPQNYHDLLMCRSIGNAINYGGQLEIKAEGICILFGDGVNLRFYNESEALPEKHQMDVEFDDHTHLIASVQMYGGLWAFRDGENENPYYLVAKEKPHPLTEVFSIEYFEKMLNSASDSLSLKAFLATEQRIPGLGNGVLQDILFNAGFHPKKKAKSLDSNGRDRLYNTVKSTLAKMTFEGGRDTERDLHGCLGGYKSILSKNTVGKPCTACGAIIKKEAYMGGSIYYCPGCQVL